MLTACFMYKYTSFPPHSALAFVLGLAPPFDLGSRGRAGREYYSSICMRAVNQSIGRSIRHAGDYASILLVDERYRDEQVRDETFRGPSLLFLVSCL